MLLLLALSLLPPLLCIGKQEILVRPFSRQPLLRTLLIDGYHLAGMFQFQHPHSLLIALRSALPVDIPLLQCHLLLLEGSILSLSCPLQAGLGLCCHSLVVVSFCRDALLRREVCPSQYLPTILNLYLFEPFLILLDIRPIFQYLTLTARPRTQMTLNAWP